MTKTEPDQGQVSWPNANDLDNDQLVMSLEFSHGVSSVFELKVDLRLPFSGVTAIYGASGSGKTTLLRCIAGLEKSVSGVLKVGGRLWQSESLFMPAHQREVGYVFQESSLLPHINALQNLLFVQKYTKLKVDQVQLAEVVELMGIGALLQSYPAQLSGGERQRVAISRALLLQPKLLLMDEPLASLDSDKKQELLQYLERLQKQFRIPILYVTHSDAEVARLADYMVVLNKGKVVAQGELNKVLSQLDLPTGFGSNRGVVLQGCVAENSDDWGLVKIDFGGGSLWAKAEGDTLGDKVRVRVLASDISIALSDHKDTSILNRLPAIVGGISRDGGSLALLKLQIGEDVLLARLSNKSVGDLQLQIGKKVWAQIKSVAIAR